jgi:hypothetical protein
MLNLLKQELGGVGVARRGGGGGGGGPAAGAVRAPPAHLPTPQPLLVGATPSPIACHYFGSSPRTMPTLHCTKAMEATALLGFTALSG